MSYYTILCYIIILYDWFILYIDTCGGIKHIILQYNILCYVLKALHNACIPKLLRHDAEVFCNINNNQTRHQHNETNNNNTERTTKDNINVIHGIYTNIHN